MRAACSDLGPQVPTDLIVGDGASIEQALDAFEEALLSLASNMCTKRMAIEKMQKMTSGAPEPAMNVDDDDDGNLTEDMELDEPKFDSMEACYKVLFELIDSEPCPLHLRALLPRCTPAAAVNICSNISPPDLHDPNLCLTRRLDQDAR
jgi:hypothetical protein